MGSLLREESINGPSWSGHPVLLSEPFWKMEVAEVDGNRTRLRWITSHTRFEGGGAHQVLGHLRSTP